MWFIFLLVFGIGFISLGPTIADKIKYRGCDDRGFDKNGINRDTGTKYNKLGYDINGEPEPYRDENGWNRYGINKETKKYYDIRGFKRDSDKNYFTGTKFDRYGYDKDGYNRDGYDKDGANKYGFDKNGEQKKKVKLEKIKCFFFDTETTGTSPAKDYIVQFGGIFGTLEIGSWNFQETGRINQLINVPIQIPEEASKVHGIYNKDLKGYGYIDEYIGDFLSFIKNADVVIGHNVEFDRKMLSGETYRLKIPFDYKSVKWIDTMKPTTKLVGIENPNGFGYKWPKLQELYQYLFHKKFKGAHDAMADITATKDCFVELCKRYDFYHKYGRDGFYEWY